MSNCNCLWTAYSTSDSPQECPSQQCESHQPWYGPPCSQEPATSDDEREWQEHLVASSKVSDGPSMADILIKRKEIIKEEKAKAKQQTLQFVVQQTESKIKLEPDAAFREVKYLRGPDGIQFKSNGELVLPKHESK